jgi:hypothetical protein
VKNLRIILLVLGWLCIALNVLYYLIGEFESISNRADYIVAYYIGSSAFAIIGMVCIYFAYRIRSRLHQKQKKSLLDALLEESDVSQTI